MAERLQERQLVLTESLNNRLSEILENQKTLVKQNDDLRKENQLLLKKLHDKDHESKGGKRKNSRVTVPRELAVSN